MKSYRAFTRLLVAVTVPKVVWLLLLSMLLLMLGETIFVLLTAVPMRGGAGSWLLLVTTFGSMFTAYALVLLGRAWQRFAAHPSVALLPAYDWLRRRIVVLAVACVVATVPLVTTLAVTGRSWRWWRAHDMATTVLSPALAPASEWWQVSTAVTFSIVGVLAGSACGIALPFLAAVAMTLAFAGSVWLWLPLPILCAGWLWKKFGGAERWPGKWLAARQRVNRRDALAALMRRRQGAVVTWALPTIVLGLAIYNEASATFTFALLGSYPLMAISPVELRQAWLMPGAAERNDFGNALFRLWIVDTGRVVVGALALIAMGTVAVTLLTASAGHWWLDDFTVQRALAGKMQHVLLAAATVFGIVWTGLRIMTCSPRYLTSGPISLGQGQWIAATVAFVIAILQIVLASADWTGAYRAWFRTWEGTALLGAVIGPLVAAVFAYFNRNAWHNANLLAVAQMLERIGRKSEGGFPWIRGDSRAR